MGRSRQDAKRAPAHCGEIRPRRQGTPFAVVVAAPGASPALRSWLAGLCPAHPLQHLLHCSSCCSKLLCIASPQYNVGIGAVLRIEEWITADRNLRVGLGDLAELGTDISFARVRANSLSEHANAGFQFRRHL